jgi:hypothetical protein
VRNSNAAGGNSGSRGATGCHCGGRRERLNGRRETVSAGTATLNQRHAARSAKAATRLGVHDEFNGLRDASAAIQAAPSTDLATSHAVEDATSAPTATVASPDSGEISTSLAPHALTAPVEVVGDAALTAASRRGGAARASRIAPRDGLGAP